VSNETAGECCAKLRELFAMFGPPKTIVVDNGPAFVARATMELCKSVGVTIEFVPAYQPEWNGFVERMNATVRYALARSCNDNYSDWSDKVAGIMFGIRARRSSVTGYSPYFLMYGFDPSLSGDEVNFGSTSVDMRLLELDNLPAIRQQLERDSRSSSKIPIFAVGAFVLVLSGSVRKKQPHSKLKRRYIGPYQVVDVQPHNLYVLIDASGNTCVHHAARLINYVARGAPLGGGV
jgi:Integrase core domain